jgi:hypothetical protein
MADRKLQTKRVPRAANVADIDDFYGAARTRGRRRVVEERKKEYAEPYRKKAVA